MNRDEALTILANRAAIDPGPDGAVGPAFEALVHDIRAGKSVADDEISAALALLPLYVLEVQRLVIGFARRFDTFDKGRPFTLLRIGVLLGYPPASARQSANALITKLGLRTSRRHDTDDD